MADRIARLVIVTALLCLAVTGSLADPAAEDVGARGWWPQFRGPHARGVADDAPLPDSWNAESGEGVAWKTAIPGLGHSSPVIWGDRLFVTTAISETDKAGIRTGAYGDIDPVKDDSTHRFVVYCLDRNTGEILWSKTAVETKPKVKRHTKSTHANPSAATDGKHLVVSFGSEGLYAYDLDGRLLWKKDLGVLDSGFYRVPDAQWGFASSPVIHAGRVIVQADVQKGSVLAAFDVETGTELWRTAREDVPTWSTPTVHDDGERAQVIVNGHRQIGGYDLATGKRLWFTYGEGDIPIPTPYVVDDRIFLTSAHGPGSPIQVLRTDANGEIVPDMDGRHPSIVWRQRRGGSYMPTTVVYDGLLYVCRDNGGLSVFDPETGELRYQTRLGTGSTSIVASGVAGDGKVYFTDEEGVTHIIAAGPKPGPVKTGVLGEVVLASPAIADGTLYFRTRDHVVAIRKPIAASDDGPAGDDDAGPTPEAPEQP